MPTEGTSKQLRIGALILAAGRSSRMGEFKPLLEIAGTSLIEHALALFRNTGVEEIVTVVGYRSAALIPIIERAASRYVVNENYQKGMFSSIQKGVAELKDKCDAFFLHPVDIPCVRTATVRKLLAQYSKNPSALVCYPQFDERRGHPPLIAARLIDHIISYAGEGGMRGLLRRYEEQAITVPVADPFLLLDVDTRQDFLRLENEIKKNTTECP
ncbi:MAG: nucleotidyltransferase family protein [Desulfobulbaceae bacterium]